MALLLIIAFLPLAASAAEPSPPAVLRRGVNLTNWFRFPADPSPRALRAYIGDPALADLRRAGFTFVRLAVDPGVLARCGLGFDPDRLALLGEAVGRIERQGLAVLVEVHPEHWREERADEERTKLLAAWQAIAPVLRGFDPALTFPEILNEPVFERDPDGWAALQAEVSGVVRAILPHSTLILAGNRWGSVPGLLRLTPLADRRIIYSVHVYDPPAFTTLGAYQRDLDPAVLGRLPFPGGTQDRCMATTAAGDANGATQAAVREYCAADWGPARIAPIIRAAAAWGRAHGVPVLLAEFGARNRPAERARLGWLRAMRQAAEAEGIGWALWGYEDGFGLAIRRPPGLRPALDPGVLDALGLRLPP